MLQATRKASLREPCVFGHQMVGRVPPRAGLNVVSEKQVSSSYHNITHVSRRLAISYKFHFYKTIPPFWNENPYSCHVMFEVSLPDFRGGWLPLKACLES